MANHSRGKGRDKVLKQNFYRHHALSAWVDEASFLRYQYTPKFGHFAKNMSLIKKKMIEKYCF